MIEQDQPIRILCVDDERNVLRALERVFLDDDYEIFIADGGEEGLRMLEESWPFQVVISDYRMPVMNGVEFLKEVYARRPETVRIVLSGYADAGAIVAAINEGHIYKFIPKPWNDDELRVTIQNCLERYFLFKKNRELLEKLALANHELEEKVRQRTEQLELRNRALEFSQSLVNNLPAGVVGIDETDMVACCNDRGVAILSTVCSDVFGVEIGQCCDTALGQLVQQTRESGSISLETALGGCSYRVLGHSFTYCGSQSVVLLFLEV